MIVEFETTFLNKLLLYIVCSFITITIFFVKGGIAVTRKLSRREKEIFASGCKVGVRNATKRAVRVKSRSRRYY